MKIPIHKVVKLENDTLEVLIYGEENDKTYVCELLEKEGFTFYFSAKLQDVPKFIRLMFNSDKVIPFTREAVINILKNDQWIDISFIDDTGDN